MTSLSGKLSQLKIITLSKLSQSQINSICFLLFAVARFQTHKIVYDTKVDVKLSWGNEEIIKCSKPLYFHMKVSSSNGV